jgi:hypothetical protein
MKIKYPIPQENARCLGSNCDRKENCSRYLSIDIDVKDYMWHGDFKKELNRLECDLFIDFRNGNYYEN